MAWKTRLKAALKETADDVKYAAFGIRKGQKDMMTKPKVEHSLSSQ